MTAWVGPVVAAFLVVVAMLNILDAIVNGRLWGSLVGGFRHVRHALICRHRPEVLFWTREPDRVCLTCQRCSWQTPGWTR